MESSYLVNINKIFREYPNIINDYDSILHFNEKMIKSFYKSNPDKIGESEALEENKKEINENHSKAILFKETIENLIKDKNNIEKILKNVLSNKCYDIVYFLVNEMKIDISVLSNSLFKENGKEINELLSSRKPEFKKIGYSFLLNYVHKNKNSQLETLYNFIDEDILSYLTEFEDINKYPSISSLLIKKILSNNNKKQLLENLIENACRKDNLELVDILLNDKEITNHLDSSKVFSIIFETKLINYKETATHSFDFSKKNDMVDKILNSNLLLETKLELLEEKYKLFLLEYFSKYNFPEKLREKVILEILNEKEFECENINLPFNIGDKGQGNGQIKVNRIFRFNKKSGAIEKICDRGYSKLDEEENKLAYEIRYLKGDEKEVTYYKRGVGENKELVKAMIKDNKIAFDIKNVRYDLRIFESEVAKINKYKNINYYDDILSYLDYAVLQLQQYINSGYDDNIDNIIFIINCRDIETLKNIISDSLSGKYGKKTIICDFGYDEHNVQVIINSGKVTIINTLDSKDRISWRIVEKIKDEINQVDIKEIFILEQTKKNCVKASKMLTVAMAMEFCNNFNNLTKLNEKLNKIKNIYDEINKLTEREQIDYLNKLDENEYNEYYNLVMFLSRKSLQLIDKSQHFRKLSPNFIKLRNNIIYAKHRMDLTQEEKEFIEKIRNDYNLSKDISYKEVCDYIKLRQKNKIDDKHKIDDKMKFLLISIKLGNIDDLDNYEEKIRKRANCSEKLTKQGLENLANIFKLEENNSYAEEIVSIINEKIAKVEKKIEKNKDKEKNFIEFNKNKVAIKNNKLIKVENNKKNKKTIDHINSLIDINNNDDNKSKLSTIELYDIDEFFENDKDYIPINKNGTTEYIPVEEEFNNLVKNPEISSLNEEEFSDIVENSNLDSINEKDFDNLVKEIENVNNNTSYIEEEEFNNVVRELNLDEENILSATV